MKLLKNLLGKKKVKHEAIRESADQSKREALIQTGRQQFRRLQELGLQIPIAAL